MNSRRPIGLLLIGVGLVILTLKLAHVYDAAQALERLSAKAGPGIERIVHRLKPEALLGLLVFLPVAAGAMLLSGSSQAKGKREEAVSIAAASPKTGAKRTQP